MTSQKLKKEGMSEDLIQKYIKKQEFIQYMLTNAEILLNKRINAKRAHNMKELHQMTDPKKPFLINKNKIETKIEHDICFFDYNYHQTNKFMILMKR